MCVGRVPILEGGSVEVLRGDEQGESRVDRSLSGAFLRAVFGVFKSSSGYFPKATTPCVVAYGYARIRRLVRLGVGFYRLPVAEKNSDRVW
jgi:hypothetical protein